MTPKQTKNVLALLGLWALTILAAAILHWRVLRYFSIAILLIAIGYLTISIIYSLLENKPADNVTAPEKEERK